jgi:hypothetical protein
MISFAHKKCNFPFKFRAEMPLNILGGGTRIWVWFFLLLKSPLANLLGLGRENGILGCPLIFIVGVHLNLWWQPPTVVNNEEKNGGMGPLKTRNLLKLLGGQKNGHKIDGNLEAKLRMENGLK